MSSLPLLGGSACAPLQFNFERRNPSPKYLIEANYTTEGVKGLMRDKASGRKAAVTSAVAALGGKVESLYYTFGKNDVIVIFDVPDNVSAAALSLAVTATGLVRTRTTPLLTVEETDQAVQKSVKYRGPGQ